MFVSSVQNYPSSRHVKPRTSAKELQAKMDTWFRHLVQNLVLPVADIGIEISAHISVLRSENEGFFPKIEQETQ